jgi:hypothetical protein
LVGTGTRLAAGGKVAYATGFATGKIAAKQK